MGREEWVGIAVPLAVCVVIFTLLAVVTIRENRKER